MTHDPDNSEIASLPELDDHIVVRLSKPIRVFNDQLTELRMRAPTAGDMMKVGGNPVVLHEDHCVHHPVFMSRMIALLTQYKKGYGIPSGSVERMACSDWADAAWSLNHFFIPPPRRREEIEDKD